MPFSQEIQVAKAAAIKAASAILRYYRNTVINVMHKSKDQPLTAADLESNDIIKTMVQTSFPDDGWLSEEDPDDALRLQKKRVWIVDPLDGTQDFINGNPEFTVSIALVEKNNPVLGVICNPVTGELFWGMRGQGAYCDETRMTVSNYELTRRARLFMSRSESRRGEWDRFKPHFDLTPMGGAAYKMALVALGKCDGCFTLRPKNEWDICAGHLLVEEAGGVVTRASGDKMTYNQSDPLVMDLVYANPVAHGSILEKLRIT